MFKRSVDQTIKIILFVAIWINIFSHAEEKNQKTYTKEFYLRDYPSFKKYIDKEKKLVNLRHNPFFGEDSVKNGAKMLGYDDLNIQRIPLLYPLFNRSDEEIKKILDDFKSDEYICHINVLIEKCRKASGDLNVIMHIVHDEGERLKQERIVQTGKTPSQLEEDTFVAAGLLVRYLFKNKLV